MQCLNHQDKPLNIISLLELKFNMFEEYLMTLGDAGSGVGVLETYLVHSEGAAEPLYEPQISWHLRPNCSSTSGCIWQSKFLIQFKAGSRALQDHR